jgi:hypothetical protein
MRKRMKQVGTCQPILSAVAQPVLFGRQENVRNQRFVFILAILADDTKHLLVFDYFCTKFEGQIKKL